MTMKKKQTRELTQTISPEIEHDLAPEEEFMVGRDPRDFWWAEVDIDVIDSEKLNTISKLMYVILCRYSYYTQGEMRKYFNFQMLAKKLNCPESVAYVALDCLLKFIQDEHINPACAGQEMIDAAQRLLANTDKEELRNER